jgi:hypothetical protein
MKANLETRKCHSRESGNPEFLHCHSSAGWNPEFQYCHSSAGWNPEGRSGVWIVGSSLQAEAFKLKPDYNSSVFINSQYLVELK